MDILLSSLDKAPRLSISIVIWISSSDTICQLNQSYSNSEAAMLSKVVSKLRPLADQHLPDQHQL